MTDNNHFPPDYWQNIKEYQKAELFCLKNNIIILPITYQANGKTYVVVEYNGKKKQSQQPYPPAQASAKCFELKLFYYRKLKDQAGYIKI